jgi:hypothetical protein
MTGWAWITIGAVGTSSCDNANCCQICGLRRKIK